MSRDWTSCGSCEEEYQVIGGSLDNAPSFCPFCGNENEADDEFEDE